MTGTMFLGLADIADVYVFLLGRLSGDSKMETRGLVKDRYCHTVNTTSGPLNQR